MSFSRKLLCAFSFIFISQVAYAEVVGLTPGQFRVNESGAATYSIPIEAPAGRAGVAPQLAVSYTSSNLSEGSMGVGWSLSGLSSISRCPSTPIHDAKLQGITFTNQDKFCLDGQRLILDPDSGSYGSVDSVYSFEVDNFSTVTARQGSSTNGPRYFEVKNKAGETYYYGDSDTISSMFSNHNDAFVEPGGFAAGVKAKTWMLKVIKDVKGNFILFNYDKDISSGSVYIDNIQYSGNLNNNKQPFAKVQFNYTAPGEYVKGFKGFHAGADILHDRLLTSIETSTDSEAFRAYRFDYDNSNFIEERTLLKSVQECPSLAASTSSCRNKTTFTWQRPGLASSSTTQKCFTGGPDNASHCVTVPTSTNYKPFPWSNTLSSSAPNPGYTQVFDISGDGIDDLVYPSGSGWYAKLGPGHSGAQYLSSVGVSQKEYVRTIDYDGDGVRDLLVANSETSNWHVITYQPTNNNGSLGSERLKFGAFGSGDNY